MDPNLHMVQEFKKPDPVTVTEVPPSKEPKLGKMETTWEVAVACCAWMDGNVMAYQTKLRKKAIDPSGTRIGLAIGRDRRLKANNFVLGFVAFPPC